MGTVGRSGHCADACYVPFPVLQKMLGIRKFFLQKRPGRKLDVLPEQPIQCGVADIRGRQNLTQMGDPAEIFIDINTDSR